jgi:hypothetical protein
MKNLLFSNKILFPFLGEVKDVLMMAFKLIKESIK